MYFCNIHLLPISDAVFVSGLLAIGSSAVLGIFCILSVIQHAMISSREKVVMPYATLVIVKLLLAFLGGASRLD